MSETKPTETAKAPESAATPAPDVPAPTPDVPTQAAEKPAAEKPADDAPAPVDGADHVGKRVAKKFRKKNYFGDITEKWTDDADKSLRFHVKYDDGDEEDLNSKELDTGLKRYEKVKRFDQKIFPRKPSAPRKRKKLEPAPPRTNKYPKRGAGKSA
mmetsp:Transcript_9002/g.19432  ORF Transcript_9002/g.19432 Transcript_9002/m.19432 type:complete len:156 (-) Transcript_9002:406-873(-)|eukprot:CAMPEP_0168175410 /NCGR_PEP_ID=MMETSP0139_2-20121125/7105_1 /TAXON_ID=44445 /ORGANISM="Pseudo-nitzschia australis, Strain 10249 10 AB" /LENGTH=155 /DNA_ID=CAMNT_0008093791 /DNA_START=77 /DNA_END=544 /DNA_ORIENTATION=-